MPFERDGKPFGADPPGALPRGLVDGATSKPLANAHSHVDELLLRANHIVRDTISEALKQAFAHMDKTSLQVQRTAQESVDHASKALQEALAELERIVERRIQSVEHGSLRRVQLAIEETVKASAKPVRRELDDLLDAITRKVLAVSIPFVAALIVIRLHTALALSASIPRLIASSAAIVGLVTGCAGSFELLRRWAARTPTQARAVFVDLIPFAGVALLLVVALLL